MTRTSLWMIAGLLGLAMAGTGCNLITGSDETGADTALADAPIELNLAYGGYEPTAEDPGFGDPTILAEFSDDRETYVDDPAVTDPEVLRMRNASHTDVYLLRIAWGHLDEEGKAPLDWSGSAHVLGGALIVRKTILFEPEDYIHRPRPDRRTVEWTSYTYNHMDGVSLMILDPPMLPTGETVLNQFVIETAPFTGAFTMEELAQIDTLITVDEEGNAIHVTGFKREPTPCHLGFMRGEWFRRGLDWGEFRGGWIDEEGRITGHLVGLWGYDADGRNVLYGKYIDTDGNFQGLIRGTFGAGPHGPGQEPQGWMRGHWYDENEQIRGTFRAQWKEARGRGRAGYFRGMWMYDCPALEVEVAAP